MDATFPIEEVRALADAACDGALSESDAARLEALLAGNVAAQRFYLSCVRLDGCLRWEFGHRSEELESAPALIPPIVLDVSPPFHSSLFALRSPVGSFLFSYTVAALILGLAILVGWTWKTSRDQQITHLVPSHVAGGVPARTSKAVARITGTVDCQWSMVSGQWSAAGRSETLDPGFQIPNQEVLIPLGAKYKVTSGLMEITYQSGAKVILQGPCTYEVDSAGGGYLSLGKLTARVEKKGEGRRAMGDQQADNQAESRDPQSEASSPSSLIPHPSSLFSVRTPTAIVTDLGTEFGVEVGSEGRTTSHVFRGSVRMQLVGGSGPEREVVLHTNDSARAEKGGGAAGPRLVLHGVTVHPGDFVRRMAAVPKLLDLLDIVASGNGLGRRRERGIDAASGREDTVFVPSYRGGDRQYRPVAWHTFIDGVFVPDGGAGPVKLDSAGHVFDGFTHTNGRTFGSIWARAADVRQPEGAENPLYWMYIMGPGKQFMPDGRGLLGLHPNAGITFRLDAMRRAYAGAVPARFRTVVGMADAHRWAENPDEVLRVDVWVFVDGRLKWNRSGLRAQDGPLPLRIDLGPSDRFLTLVSAAYRSVGGWVVFGDPVLELDSTKPEKAAD
jgi:hypothetical protein